MGALLHALEVPLILFFVIVAPIWLVLHYRSKRHSGSSSTIALQSEPLGQNDPEVAELWQTTRRMEERIRTLERILDADVPNWRGRI